MTRQSASQHLAALEAANLVTNHAGSCLHVNARETTAARPPWRTSWSASRCPVAVALTQAEVWPAAQINAGDAYLLRQIPER
jgi:hypothetical protein